MAVKRKGCFAYSDDLAIHSNHSMQCVARSACEFLMNGTPVLTTLMANKDVFEFLITVKVPKSNSLIWNGNNIQKTGRVFASKDGHTLTKIMPAGGVIGEYKRKPKISKSQYQSVMKDTNGEWDERVCTGNKSKYAVRVASMLGNNKVLLANDLNNIIGGDVDMMFFNHVNYKFYESEVLKLTDKFNK